VGNEEVEDEEGEFDHTDDEDAVDHPDDDEGADYSDDDEEVGYYDDEDSSDESIDLETATVSQLIDSLRVWWGELPLQGYYVIR
jgi:hypothetical protein